MSRARVDKPFLIIILLLAVSGFFIFSSASLGLLARGGTNYTSVTFSQTVLGLFLGTLTLIIVTKLDYKIWKKIAFFLLLIAIILNILVLLPGIGFEHGGARRWINLGFTTFQPSEFLKLAVIVYFAAWASGVKSKLASFKFGFLPLLILMAISSALLLAQPDTDTLLMILVAGGAMYIAGGGRWRHLLILLVIGALGLALVAFTRPYIMQRITSFLDPTADAQGAGYQVQQSLIAIGSGGIMGRGFGQSVQKFSFLPEPVSDSIFAVAAEEFGFVGGLTLIVLFVAFASRGLKIASRVPDIFSRLTVVGIVIMITFQAFVNMGAMLGVLPISGITLPFVSHGGTSLFFTLLESGIVLSISRTQTKKI